MKTPPRVFLAESASEGDEVQLRAGDSHYLLTVLRLSSGAQITICDPSSGQTFEGVLSDPAQEPCKVRIVKRVLSEDPSPRCHTVCMPPPKGERLDWACEKLSELGVRELLLFRAERSVVQYSHADSEKKLIRLMRLAESAARQSGRAVPMRIRYLPSLEATLATLQLPLYFGSLTLSARSIRELPLPTTAVSILVGPEGGLSGQEERLICDHGGIPISLGALILRVETAAMVAASHANGVWGPPPAR